MKKNYIMTYKNLEFKTLSLFVFILMLNINAENVIAQCSNYQVYESIGTSIPTSGGTWAATSMTYSTGNSRTGDNNLVFNAAGDIIQTPQIANPAVFSFWYRRSGATGGVPQFTIETSPDAGTWTVRGTVTPGATYTQYTLDLNALSLTNVYIRIRDSRSSGTAERYVDDISWTSTTSNTVIPALANCSQTITCGTTYSFSDPGGINDTYNSSIDYTVTFTPSIGTNKVQLIFSSFNTENLFDGMVIYNGPSTASPIISSGLGVGSNATNCPAGSFYGTTSPGTITSTDASGAITIRFRSDISTVRPGWLASVACVAPPTITNLLTASSGCLGSNITITGTNLTGTTATNIKIGGISAISSITSNNGSTIVAVLGTAASGNVSVTAAGGTATSTGVFTVNPLPAAISGPASVCSGLVTNYTDATAGGTWSITNGTGTASINTSGDVTGGTSGTVTVNYTLATTCSTTKTINVDQSPGAIAGGASTVCAGSSTPAFTNPIAGGVWSVTNVSGTATMTGAVLNALTGGTVTVNYTVGACAPATYTVTINSLPTNPSNPTSNSPQCNPPGVTLTRATAPPGTEDYYWQTVSLGTATTNNTNTYTTTTTGTYYIRARNISTGCWSSGQGSLAIVVTPNVSALATAPSPSNAATGVCYLGSGAISSISWTAAANATSYDVYFGAGSLPGSITSNVATTSYTTGSLLASTTYYWKIVPKNSCGITSGAPITWTFTTSASACYCTPTYSSGTGTNDYITNVTLGALNNTTGKSASPYYTFYNAVTIPNVLQSSTASISITFAAEANQYGAVWIDFNQNGVFEASEGGVSTINAGSGGTTIINIAVPAGATLGNTRMRVRGADDSALTTAQPCGASNSNFGETEDYIVNIIAPTLCTVPNPPTTLSLSTITSTSINGSFVAPTPAASGYIIIRSSSATAPTLVNGTTYAVGFTGLIPGTTRVIQGSALTSNALSFSDTGLTSNTIYYYHIFSYNDACTGAPFYSTTSIAINNTATTCPAAPASAANSAITTSGFTVTWPASIVGGSAGTITYTLEIYSDSGYTSPISGSPFSLGTGTSYSATGLTGGITYYYRIKANNGSCDSPYLNGSCGTLITNDNCSGAIALTVNTTPTCTTSTNATTVGATLSQTGCTGNADDDVWFSFVAVKTSHTVTVTPNTLSNPVYELFTGTCGALSAGVCVNNTGAAAGTEAVIFTGFTVGQTYFVRVYSNGNASNAGTFNICITSPPANDECSGAIPLTVSGSCSYSTYSNAFATSSTGIPAPGCGSYTGGDVWFSAVVPPSGVLTVDTQAGSVTDADMAFYSGSCGSLTLLECDDYDGSGFMPYITMTGLTPGQTIYIRVWEFGNDNNGTFGICATTPSCPPPTGLFANILSTTSASVYWTGTASASNGYEYFITTTNSPPTVSSTPSGTTAAGVVGVTLNSLISGQIYYLWVRANCGAGDISTWYGPTNFTPCAVGNHLGTTSLSCPTPDAVVQGSGVDINGNLSMACDALTCPSLQVSYATIKQTTDYTVSSITYSPPYQFKCLENPVSVNVDDKWSPLINLPFDFCFYGNSYNKCLMGSNGVLTFDTTNNSPGGRSEWEFFNNLPSTNLFRNSIFGVYHDIDPSKGGQVGWELVTLNSGCRALVASWSDIPMFSSSCNSSLYTGMIVLYENTNVIDVYIKEKNICSTWNDGNAIVGLQNSTATAAVVAPGRNGLDTDWTITSEAWRFTPNGATVVPTVQWYQGSISPANAIAGATTTTLNVCPTVSTSYIAEVNYSLCTGDVKFTDNAVITVTGNKIWTGGTSTDWNTSTNWSPSGVPTSANCVIIPVVGNGRYPLISSTPNGVGYNLAVYSNASLTLGANQNLTITDKITVQSPSTGSFTVNNNANLIQINDTAVNTGSIFYKRIAPNIKGSDYVYWSSPVLNQNMGTFYDSGTPGLKYQWNPILNNGNGAGGNVSQGIWEGASGIMTRARGYIIRGSSSFGAAASNIPVTFNGTPFNGVIPYTVQRGSYTGGGYNGANGVPITNLNDNYNLLGNPYPSSINALKFLQLNTYNASTNPTGQILGNVKLWLHGIDPTYGAANPFYGSYLYNYSANDYLTLNYMGSTTPSVADIIKSGQAFFVQMVDGAAGSGTVNFNNSMRYDGSTLPYNNGSFFKNGNTADTENSLERHRIWLDLVDANNQSSPILLGYATDATNNYDSLFDAPTAIPSGMKLFSMIENDSEVYDIQGRSLPFNVNDEISIGIKAPTQGNYTFAIKAVDGLFENQSIYLKDNLLNITHNLKANPYHFTTIAGAIKDRFKVVYIDNALGTMDYLIDNNIKVMTNEQVSVSSSNLQMESIAVYNVLGQKLATYKDINTNLFTLSNLHKNTTTLFLKIKLQTGETVTKKIIY